MSKQDGNLSPRERVEAALKLHQMESPGTPTSVSRICTQASVSRANLYEHHPDLVRRILGAADVAKRHATKTTSVAELKKRLAAEKRRTSALLLVCVELQAEVQRLRARETLNSSAPSRKPSRKDAA